MEFLKAFRKPEEMMAIDIGSGAIKIAELEIVSGAASIRSFAVQPIPADIFSSNLISKPDQLAEIIEKMCEAHDLYGKRVIFSIPSPAVFTKRIKMQKQSDNELRGAVQFEAANFIPHKIDAVKLDYAILGETGKNQLDLLVVAAKTELLDNYEKCLSMAGLESAVADVDFFALHNLLEYAYGKEIFTDDKAVAVLNIGYRYSSLTISKNAVPVFVGDISIGIKNLEEDLAIKLSLSEAEIHKSIEEGNFKDEWKVHIDGFLDQTALELNRQISFFWNTCGLEGEIAEIFLTGGGTFIPGFQQAFERKSGVQVKLLDVLGKFTVDEAIDQSYLKKSAPLLSVVLGLGLRGVGV